MTSALAQTCNFVLLSAARFPQHLTTPTPRLLSYYKCYVLPFERYTLIFGFSLHHYDRFSTAQSEDACHVCLVFNCKGMIPCSRPSVSLACSSWLNGPGDGRSLQPDLTENWRAIYRSPSKSPSQKPWLSVDP